MSKTYRRSRQRRNKLSKKRGGGPKSHRPSQVEIKYVGRPNFMLDTPPQSSAEGYQPARIARRKEGNKIIFVIPTSEGAKKELHMTLAFHRELLRETYGNFKKVQDYFISTRHLHNKDITNEEWVCVTPSVGNNRSGYFAVIPEEFRVIDDVNDTNIDSPVNIERIKQDNEEGIFWFPNHYDILKPALTQGMIQEKKPNERGILWLPDESWPEIPTFESISKVIASRTSHAPTASRAPAAPAAPAALTTLIASRSIKPSISKQPISDARREDQLKSIQNARTYFKNHPYEKIGWYSTFNEGGYGVGVDDVNNTEFEQMLINEVPKYSKRGETVMFSVPPCFMCKHNLHH